jgi:hypothetical protein
MSTSPLSAKKATSVFDGIRDLQQKLEVNERKAEVETTDQEILPMPVFLKNGPAKFNDLSHRINGQSTEAALAC